MSRSQQSDTYNQAKGQNSGYYDESQNSYAKAQQDVGNYEDQLGKYAASNPFTAGGEFQTSMNKTLANTSDAAARAAGQTLQSQSLRTGQNSAGAVAATEAMQQQDTRDLSADQGKENADRIGAESDYNRSVLGASALPEQMDASLAGQRGQLAQGTLNTQEEAAKTPSWMEDLNQGLMNAGASFAGAMCPATGSLYLLPDGREVTVESLRAGDEVQGIDGEPQMIEAVHSAPAEILRVRAEDGQILRCSRTHAFALPYGGFTEAQHALGKIVRTKSGNSRIVAINEDGVSMVFNVITDGSHTYCSNGFWSLGMGEAEARVSMQEKGVTEDRMAGVSNG